LDRLGSTAVRIISWRWAWMDLMHATIAGDAAAAGAGEPDVQLIVGLAA
jgi:hypothetical protein